MYIRKAQAADMDQIMKLYQMARDFQRKSLNLIQWEDNYPDRTQLIADMTDEGSYVVVENEKLSQLTQPETIIGTFYLQEGPDQVYLSLKNKWPDIMDIVTVHRVASHNAYMGVGNFIFTWLQKQYSNIMIDTHPQNEVMKYLIQKYKFTYLGVVTLDNGGLRNTYQWIQGEV